MRPDQTTSAGAPVGDPGTSFEARPPDPRRAPSADRRTDTAPALSLIIPTYNEAENLPILVDRVVAVLAEVDYEIIVVDDDSPDGTWQVAEQLAAVYDRLRIIRRTDDRGLSSAVMLGMSTARGRAIAVMDADLQHDERILPDLIEPILEGDADVVVASREVDGGSYGEFSDSRRRLSVIGAQLARTVTGTTVSDPMSGFFAISREHHDRVATRANPRGFKILLEFLVRGSHPRVAEVGYQFGARQHGETKLTTSVAFSYLISLASLVTGRLISATMTAYLVVGMLGVLVRFGLPSLAGAIGLTIAAPLAFEASVLANYFMNNAFTFAAERRRGLRLIMGLLPFHLVALHGVIVQAGVISVASSDSYGATEGPLGLQLAGIALATAGNYALNRTVTWRRRTFA